jgi:hypothetical protein
VLGIHEEKKVTQLLFLIRWPKKTRNKTKARIGEQMDGGGLFTSGPYLVAQSACHICSLS